MRPGQQKNRMRGRGRKGPNPLSRSYESNGPDVKIRGNAQHIAEKYTALARDASASGDRVMAENYLQHAEHYGRIVAAAQGTFQLQREETDFEGEYDEEGDENVQENGVPNGHPYPVPERAQNERPPQQQPSQMRGERERGDYNNRDQNRDYNNNRDSQNGRDGGQGNRDFNRDGGQGNREQRFNRDDRNRNRDRDFNRDNQGRDRNRDGNRDNRPFNNDERRSFEGRGERNNGQDRGERVQPNGLGPQPVVGELPDGDVHSPAVFVREDRAPNVEHRDNQRPAEDEANAAVVTQESGFGQSEASPTVLAQPEGSILPPGEDAEQPVAEGPRRRGRPRRPRLGEGDAVPAQAAEEHAAPEPVSQAPAAEPVAEAAAAEDAPVKRPRGRPRKKKADDENGEADAGHMPDFLLASNG